MCARAVDVLKKGPANIPQIIKKGKLDRKYKYTDPDFGGTDALYWKKFTNN